MVYLSKKHNTPSTMNTVSLPKIMIIANTKNVIAASAKIVSRKEYSPFVSPIARATFG